MSSQDPCWVCKEPAKSTSKGFIITYDCIRCAKYSIDLSNLGNGYFNTEREIANASGWLNENSGTVINQPVFLKLKNLTRLSINARADRLLIWLESESDQLGEVITINSSNKKLLAISWSTNQNEVDYLINHLISQKLIVGTEAIGSNNRAAQILASGFTHLENINKNIQSNIGFCAMSFAAELRSAWDDAISPAIIEAGYDPVRIDSEEYNTGVVDQIKARIRQSKFVIADLTMHRNGVYYEAGFADGLNRPVIFTCKENEFEKAHFDVQHINTIKWSSENIAEFKDKLRWRIEGTLGHGKNGS